MGDASDEFRVSLQANVENITGSEVFCSLFNPSMANFVEDPWPAIQLAIAILLDKPIILAIPTGREKKVPKKLRLIADAVIEGSPEQLAAKIAAFMNALPDAGVRA